MTRESVQGVNPLDRTVAHWAVLVDWDLQRQRPYVIVDPYDPEGLLYLSRSEYLSQLKVCASNDLTVIVVARPGSHCPQTSDTSSPDLPSKNSPPSDSKGGDSRMKDFFSSRENRLTWRDFLSLRRFVKRGVSVKDGMVTVRPETISRVVLLWIIQLLHYSAVTSPERRLLGFNPFVRALTALMSNNGPGFLTQRLKISLFAVYSYVGGNPLQTTEPLGQRVKLANGLPVLIPRPFRDEIRKGNLRYIRIWVSLLNFYRSLNVKVADPETAYEVIRTPKPNLADNPVFERWVYFCKEVFPRLVASQASDGKAPTFRYASNRGLIINSAAVNLRNAAGLGSIILDARAWASRPKNLPQEWFKFHNDETSSILMERIEKETHADTFVIRTKKDQFGNKPGSVLQEGIYDSLDLINPVWNNIPDAKAAKAAKEASHKTTVAAGCLVGSSFELIRPAREGSYSDLFFGAHSGFSNPKKMVWKPSGPEGLVGRLFNFPAPGGKLRTVAICDYWTQMCVRSVHDHLFLILKILHQNDATFDQQGTVDKYFERKLFPHWSFDLKAATDTIPLDLYIECLAPFLRQDKETYEHARERALLWSRLMTERDFGLPAPKKGEKFFPCAEKRTIRYATGQPMGAFSSWASMALVHHALVQFSNWLGPLEAQTSEKTPGEIVKTIPLSVRVTPPKGVWFPWYLVLGDDVDISKVPMVADNYQFTCGSFGIKIGLAKSLRSLVNSFEFANQRFCPEGNISPLSFMEEYQSSMTWKARIEFASRIAKRFGLDVNESTLIRLILTARQWRALMPELSGMRPRLILRLLGFIVKSPLNPTWSDPERVPSLDTINDWLSSLNEALKNQVSPEQYRLLEASMRDAVADAVRAYATRRRDAIPPSRYSYTYIEPVSRFIKDKLGRSVGTTLTQWNERVVPRPGAPYSWSYIEYCINLHNEKISKRLATMAQKNWRALRARVVTEPAMLLGPIQDAVREIPLAKWIQLWSELGNIPAPINLDSRRVQLDGITSVLRGTITLAQQRDHAETLLRVILPVVAKATGHTIASVPYYPIDGTRGRHWPRLLRRSLAAFNAAQAAIAASPFLGPNPDWVRAFAAPYLGTGSDAWVAIDTLNQSITPDQANCSELVQ